MSCSKTLLALAALLALGAPAAQAQSAKDFDDLKAELKALRAEIEALKKKPADAAKPADGTNWGERLDIVELKQKDAVVLGDIGGGFRLPGSETSLHLYGYAEAHMIHDVDRTAPDDSFTNLSFQPTDSDVGGNPLLGQKGKTKLTAQTSRFGFETSTPTNVGTFNTKLEFDFYSYSAGNRNRLRIRHAYGEYAGWLIGQTWSTFMDVDDLPETVDFNGPIGSPFSRRTMVRYTYNDPTFAKFTFAAEDPEDQFGGGSANERLPELVGRIDKSYDWGAVNVRALVHEKRSVADSKIGYGWGVGGSYKLTDKDLLMGQFAVVQGDIDQMYGSNGYNFDDAGKISFDNNKGLVVGWSRTIADNLRSNVVFGMNKGSKATMLNNNQSLKQLHLDLIYNPIKNIDLGTELILGQRKTFDGETANMNRFDLMARYSF